MKIIDKKEWFTNELKEAGIMTNGLKKGSVLTIGASRYVLTESDSGGFTAIVDQPSPPKEKKKSFQKKIVEAEESDVHIRKDTKE